MPSGLPGFLRRSLRIGYDDDDGDDDGVGTDDHINDNIIEQRNERMNNNPNHGDNTATDNNTTTTTGSNFMTTNNQNVVSNNTTITPPSATNDNNSNNNIRNDRTIEDSNPQSTTRAITNNNNTSNLAYSNSNSVDYSDYSDDDDDDDERYTLRTLSQHHQQQQQDIYNMSHTSSPGGSSMSNPLSPTYASDGGNLSLSTSPSKDVITRQSLLALHDPETVGITSPTPSSLLQRSDSNNSNVFVSFRNSVKKTYREKQFEKVLNVDVVNINELRALAWNGIPIQYRAMTWKILLGYVPLSASRRVTALKRKRNEYIESCVVQHWDNVDDDNRPLHEQEVLRQVLVDVPRTQPSIPLFRNDKIKRLLSRLLFIWAMRHPASSYVQGINDIATPLIAVFLTDYFINNNDWNPTNSTTTTESTEKETENGNQDGNRIHDNYTATTDREASNGNGNDSSNINVPSIEAIQNNNDFLKELPDIVLEGHVMNQFPDDKLDELEADVYWCLTNLLAGIQDHYTADQPGLQRMVGRLEELVNRIDSNLCNHLQDVGIMFIQFSFKWMNCLLLREFTLKCVYRLWDTYLSEPSGGFEEFHVYVCAAFLCQFSAQIQTMQFDEIFTFLQQIPATKDWTDTEVSILLSQAFVLSTLFRNSDAHLTSFQR